MFHIAVFIVLLDKFSKFIYQMTTFTYLCRFKNRYMSLQRENKNILVTGASGFIGSFLVEGALERGILVWAGVRKSSSRKYLLDDRIQFAELDFGNKDKLKEQLSVHKQEHNGCKQTISVILREYPQTHHTGSRKRSPATTPGNRHISEEILHSPASCRNRQR